MSFGLGADPETCSVAKLLGLAWRSLGRESAHPIGNIVLNPAVGCRILSAMLAVVFSAAVCPIPNYIGLLLVDRGICVCERLAQSRYLTVTQFRTIHCR